MFTDAAESAELVDESDELCSSDSCTEMGWGLGRGGGGGGAPFTLCRKRPDISYSLDANVAFEWTWCHDERLLSVIRCRRAGQAWKMHCHMSRKVNDSPHFKTSTSQPSHTHNNLGGHDGIFKLPSSSLLMARGVPTENSPDTPDSFHLYRSLVCHRPVLWRSARVRVGSGQGAEKPSAHASTQTQCLASQNHRVSLCS